MTDSAVVFLAAPEEKKMLDRPNSKEGWLARAALKPEGRAFVDGAYVGAPSGKTFARTSPVDVVIPVTGANFRAEGGVKAGKM